MKLQFTNDIEDLVAFNRFFCERTGMHRSQARTIAFIYFALVLLIGLSIALTSSHDRPFDDEPVVNPLPLLVFFLVLAVVVGVVSYFVMKWFILHKIGNMVRKLQRLKPDKTVLAHREMEVADGHLIERNDFGDFRWKLSAIEEIAETPDYVFVCVSAQRAYILPRACFSEVELEEFLDDLEAPSSKMPPRLPVSTAPPATDAFTQKPRP